MTNRLQLGIPTPCSENWGNMSPGADGRFCSSCSKTVLDFTDMDDKEILQWFANHEKGSACGRFRPDQLNRPIVAPPERKSRWRYWQYLIAGLLFSTEVSAQTKPAAPPMSQQISPNRQDDIVMGKMARLPEPQPPIDSIRGRVMDPDGDPVRYATIKYSRSHGVVADDGGYFSIPVSKALRQAMLYISALGYKSDTIAVKQFLATNQTQIIVLKGEERILGEVVVVPAQEIIRKPVADTISIIKDAFAAIGLVKKSLTIFPNPVAKGNTITVSARLDQTGTYTIQLFSMSGTLMQTTQVNGAPKTPTFSINIPGTLTPGTYIVRVSHPALTKTYSEEVVVF